LDMTLSVASTGTIGNECVMIWRARVGGEIDPAGLEAVDAPAGGLCIRLRLTW
jgi:hypothetical protein